MFTDYDSYIRDCFTTTSTVALYGTVLLYVWCVRNACGVGIKWRSLASDLSYGIYLSYLQTQHVSKTKGEFTLCNVSDTMSSLIYWLL